MSTGSISAWLPDRTPTWGDVVAGIAAGIWLLIDTKPSGWDLPWVAVGCVVIIVGFGPATKTTFGNFIRNRSEESGVVWRVLILSLIIVVFFGAEYTLNIQSETAVSFINGVFLGFIVSVSVFVLYTGEVSGWHST